MFLFTELIIAISFVIKRYYKLYSLTVLQHLIINLIDFISYAYNDAVRIYIGNRNNIGGKKRESRAI